MHSKLEILAVLILWVAEGTQNLHFHTKAKLENIELVHFEPVLPKCGHQSSSFSITQRCIRNKNSWVLTPV